jgi:hypothetical protein
LPGRGASMRRSVFSKSRSPKYGEARRKSIRRGLNSGKFATSTASARKPISWIRLLFPSCVKAKAETSWRFWGLYVHVCKPETLRAAYVLTKEHRKRSENPGWQMLT